MRKTLALALALVVLGTVTSCKKAPLTIGKTVIQERELGAFHHLSVNDDINVTLVRSDSCHVVISAGENIIDNITTDISNDTLIFRNENRISWIRTYDYRIDATLYFKDIKSLTHGSCGELRTKNQFNAEDAPYKIEIYGGSGDVFMEFNGCSSLKVNYEYGTSQLNLNGKDNRCLDIYKKSYGLVHAENLEADSVTIVNKSTGNCWIKANEYIHSRIENLGDIYYKGEPKEIVEEYGDDARGRLIRYVGD